MTETRNYNNRTWLSSLSVGFVYSVGLTYAGNGNVLTGNDNVNGNWTYTYDTLNRLNTAGKTGVSMTFSPDRYGNMTCTASGGPACTPLGLSFDTTTNRINTSGYTYDGAGNLVTDNTHHYVYDLENRITCVWGTDGTCTSYNATNYFYDANGTRVGKQQANTLEDYVMDPEGHIVSVHDGSANLLRAELYSGGRHVATSNSNGLFFHHADWLGTERVRTNSSGGFVQSFADTPYGMNLVSNPSTDVSPMHFTGKQRDYETGLDYFGARYNASNLGRFMTPDRPFADQHAGSPQSWNLYSYTRNNPLRFIDDNGERVVESPPKTVYYHVSGNTAGEAWNNAPAAAKAAGVPGGYRGNTDTNLQVGRKRGQEPFICMRKRGRKRGQEPLGKSGQARYFLFVLGRIDRPAVISLDLPGFQA